MIVVTAVRAVGKSKLLWTCKCRRGAFSFFFFFWYFGVIAEPTRTSRAQNKGTFRVDASAVRSIVEIWPASLKNQNQEDVIVE